MKKILISIFAAVILFSGAYASAALTCSVASACNSPDTAVFKISGTSNAHAELSSQANYSKYVCCSGVSGIGNSCSGTSVTVARLSKTTNAHVEENTQSNYANNACLSISSGTVSVGYQNSNCTGFDTILASISGATNAHVGNSGAYTKKICASAAATVPPTPPSSSGGSAGPTISPPNVIFSGRAYPGSAVTLLKDAQIAAQTVADPNSNFEISLSGLSSGNYSFSIYGEDKNNIRSTLFTFPVTITSGATVRVGGIFIAPTIAVDKSEVKRGDNIAIFGQSAPQADVTISMNSETETFVKTKSDQDGIYLYNFDTAPLEMGQHLTKSKAAIGNEISSFGKTAGFLVGTKNVAAALESIFLKGDLNNDKRVNLVDFSIAAYWYKRQISPVFALIEKERLNGDGKVNLVDFSIMAFNWTG